MGMRASSEDKIEPQSGLKVQICPILERADTAISRVIIII